VTSGAIFDALAPEREPDCTARSTIDRVNEKKKKGDLFRGARQLKREQKKPAAQGVTRVGGKNSKGEGGRTDGAGKEK